MWHRIDVGDAEWLTASRMGVNGCRRRCTNSIAPQCPDDTFTQGEACPGNMVRGGVSDEEEAGLARLEGDGDAVAAGVPLPGACPRGSRHQTQDP